LIIGLILTSPTGTILWLNSAAFGGAYSTRGILAIVLECYRTSNLNFKLTFKEDNN